MKILKIRFIVPPQDNISLDMEKIRGGFTCTKTTCKDGRVHADHPDFPLHCISGRVIGMEDFILQLI